MSFPYVILDRMRRGEPLEPGTLEDVVRGATDGSWDEAQLGAFLMAAAIRGLDREQTAELSRAMLASGSQWQLGREIAGLGDKHSTGGVGDKVSLVLAPLLAASDVPLAMLTGRGLGHTGGTADKLESIPGVRLGIDRDDAVSSLRATGMAIGIATDEVAPADRRLYSLRDVTGTVASIPLIVASILSKKLALGAAGVVYDVKSGSGAILHSADRAAALATQLVEVSRELGQPARALVTDMSQPLGRWVGHAAEVEEALACLEGEGPEDLTTLSVELGAVVAQLVGRRVSRDQLRETLSSGRGREVFLSWAERQGADASWLRSPKLEPAPHRETVETAEAGWIARIDARGLGLLLAELGGGRRSRDDAIDHGVSLEAVARLGDRVEAGDPLMRFFLRRPVPDLAERARACVEFSQEPASAPPLVARRIGIAPDTEPDLDTPDRGHRAD